MRIRICIQREIDYRVAGQPLVLSGERIDEKLTFIIAAIRYIENKILVTWKEYAPQHLGAIKRSLEPPPL